MTRFKDDKAPWMPRINGDRFRSRIVCVRSSTPGIHTRTRAYTHTHTHTLTSSSAIPALKIEFTRNLFSTSQRFLCFFGEEREGEVEGVRLKAAFFFLPFHPIFPFLDRFRLAIPLHLGRSFDFEQ